MPLCTGLSRKQSEELYDDILCSKDVDCLRRLCREDLYFLLRVGCKRFDFSHDFLYDRCREVEESPDGNLDLWFREARKSTIITYGKTIQDILIDPDETIGIFSHTSPIAKSFLYQVKNELESNSFLKDLFPDILYQDPKKESPRWSLDAGIIVKRKSNPKEATVEAHGLVDGQPTSKHFSIQVYDDVVVKESVTSPEMIRKTTEAWELSLNLGAERRMDDGSVRQCRRRYVGTRYHHQDTYQAMIDRKVVRIREYYPTDLGKRDIDVEGNPVLFSKEYLDEKRRSMGIHTYGTQMLQDPTADKAAGFDIEWLDGHYYHELKKFNNWNFYLLVDGANEKKKSSDHTAMIVLGLAPDQNYYLVDGVYDKLNLTERTNWLFKLHRKWHPKATGYERYGKDSDIQHIQYVQDQEGYRFPIIELGGSMPKNDRIRRLVPIFEQGRFYMPWRLLFKKSDGTAGDLVACIKDEYADFPMGSHDDGIDCIARITDEDLGAVFPKEEEPKEISTKNVKYDPTAVPMNGNPYNQQYVADREYDPMRVPN